jgi:hypothetical protein
MIRRRLSHISVDSNWPMFSFYQYTYPFRITNIKFLFQTVINLNKNYFLLYGLLFKSKNDSKRLSNVSPDSNWSNRHFNNLLTLLKNWYQIVKNNKNIANILKNLSIEIKTIFFIRTFLLTQNYYSN